MPVEAGGEWFDIAIRGSPEGPEPGAGVEKYGHPFKVQFATALPQPMVNRTLTSPL
jgi:hypothetical protein